NSTRPRCQHMRCRIYPLRITGTQGDGVRALRITCHFVVPVEAVASTKQWERQRAGEGEPKFHRELLYFFRFAEGGGGRGTDVSGSIICPYGPIASPPPEVTKSS